MWVVDVVALVIGAAGLTWGIFKDIELRRTRGYVAQVERLGQQRAEAIGDLVGDLTHLYHYTDEPGGQQRHEPLIEKQYRQARECARENMLVLGQDAIDIVNRETDLAREVFWQQRHEGRASPDSARKLQTVRMQRATLLMRLGKSRDFPPPPGSLISAEPASEEQREIDVDKSSP